MGKGKGPIRKAASDAEVTDVLDMAEGIISRTLALMPPRFDSREARIMLRAIGLQESKFETRQQYHGPARSYWQHERGGGIYGVLHHEASKTHAQRLCALEGVPATPDAVYQAMLTNDIIGCGFSRLLLFTDPRPLPKVGDVEGAWAYYRENWRPGAPHPDAWPGNYGRALER